MQSKTLVRTASFLLFLHGLFEISGLLGLLPNVGGPATGEIGGHGLKENMYFFVVIGALWGIARWIAGCGLWSMKKWAFVLALIISGITLNLAIAIIPFGIVDMLFALPVTVILLVAWFGKETFGA